MPSDGWEMKGELPHQRMLRIALNPEKELLGHWRNMSFDLDINIFWYNMQMTYHCTLMHHQTTQLLWNFPLPTREISPILVYWSDWSILSILIKLAKRWSSISNYNVVKTVPFAPSPSHHFYRCYKPLKYIKIWVVKMTFFYPHTHIIHPSPVVSPVGSPQLPPRSPPPSGCRSLQPDRVTNFSLGQVKQLSNL